MNYKMIKFKLTDEKMSNQLELDAYRIVALRDFGDVKAGDLGGFVEFESNLSHDGDCWIGEHGVVVHRCKVQGNAKIDYAELYNGCSIGGDTIISGGYFSGENINILGGCIKETKVAGENITIKGGIIDESIIGSNVYVSGGSIISANIENCLIASGDFVDFDIDGNHFHSVCISYGIDERLEFTVDSKTKTIHGLWKPMKINKYIKTLRDGGFDKIFIERLNEIIKILVKLKGDK